MTNEEADKAQEWRGMDGATAWHLIDRHAEDWHETGEMMNAWLRAAVLAEREACAKVCENLPRKFRSEFDKVSDDCAAEIRKRSNVELRGGPAVSSPERPA